MTKQKKPRRLELLTLRELRPFVADYHQCFPNWKILDGTLIGRESGPVLQYIGFDRLSGGAYRIQCGVYYLCVPHRDGGLPPQFLSVGQAVYPGAHESIKSRIVEAIHLEVIPSVKTMLVPEQVLSLHESYEFIRSPDAHHLASLNAYLGHDERALYWCARFTELVDSHGLGWQDFDHKRRAFLDQLEQWLKAGEAQQQLERIVQEERRKWGLA